MPQVSSALELSGCHQPTLPCPQDIELILDTAETEAPGLRDLARRFLGAQATHLGVPLDGPASWRAGPREYLRYTSLGWQTNSSSTW